MAVDIQDADKWDVNSSFSWPGNKRIRVAVLFWALFTLWGLLAILSAGSAGAAAMSMCSVKALYLWQAKCCPELENHSEQINALVQCRVSYIWYTPLPNHFTEHLDCLEMKPVLASSSIWTWDPFLEPFSRRGPLGSQCHLGWVLQV